MRSLRFIGRANKNNVPHMTTRWAGRDDGISPDEVHPGEGRFCGEAQAKAIALKGLDIMDTQTLLIIYYSCSPPWRRRLVRPGTLVLGGSRVPIADHVGI
jgi:hypothetical protein